MVICHKVILREGLKNIELPLLAPFDEETPTESKFRSNLEIGPKMASKCYFQCVHTVLLSSIIYHIYIIFFDLIKVAVNISESCMSVYLCSLKSSLGVKLKISAVLKLLVQKKNSNTISETTQKFNILPCDIFLKNIL